ncbi:MAG: hypothetical protein NTW18_05050 [Candidatus Omnitrophica bacterium]|nr:hypothetical protein [Candidatus Omnitrophota bacterium]
MLLITRPEHDEATHYLSKWSEQIIDIAQKKNVKVIDLHREKANRNRVIGILEKTGAKLVILNGHGSDISVHGHDNEVILKEDDNKAIKGKIIYARSCNSAKKLGQNCITQGALAYLGYKEEFIVASNSTNIRRPLEDKTAELFLEPSNHIPIALLKGHTTGDANNRSKDLFKKNIGNLVIEGPSSYNYFAIRYLLWDMSHQVCLGDEGATFT